MSKKQHLYLDSFKSLDAATAEKLAERKGERFFLSEHMVRLFDEAKTEAEIKAKVKRAYEQGRRDGLKEVLVLIEQRKSVEYIAVQVVTILKELEKEC